MNMNSGAIWRITPPEILVPAQPECCEGLWEDRSSTVTDTGLDPILWTDQKSGRTFASNSTVGANAVYAYTDSDGDPTVTSPTGWTPFGIAAPNGGADHETIGSGPYPVSLSALGTPANQGEAVYYCSQDVVGPASCYRSDTLGASYGPSTFAYNGQGTNRPWRNLWWSAWSYSCRAGWNCLASGRSMPRFARWCFQYGRWRDLDHLHCPPGFFPD